MSIILEEGFTGKNDDTERGVTAYFTSWSAIMPGWFNPWPYFVMPVKYEQ
jgi:hypothetical protein